MVEDVVIEKAAIAYWNAGTVVRRWSDEDEEQRVTVRQRMRAALDALEADGYRICPPGTCYSRSPDTRPKS